MSTSLVHASLELLDVGNDVNKGIKKKKYRSQGVLELIPANHRLIKKGKKSTNLRSVKRITVHDAKKQLHQFTDYTEEKVRRLLLLSNSRIDSEVAGKLIDRAVTKRPTFSESIPKTEEPTAFTEEDFKKFEAEYQF